VTWKGSGCVTDVSSRTTIEVVTGGTVEWFDDHALVVGSGG